MIEVVGLTLASRVLERVGEFLTGIGTLSPREIVPALSLVICKLQDSLPVDS